MDHVETYTNTIVDCVSIHNEQCISKKYEISPFRDVLRSFIEREDEAYTFRFSGVVELEDLSVYTYILSSQFWPIEHEKDNDFLWNHRLVIYKPKEIKQKTAFMYVNGGSNKDENGNTALSESQEKLDFGGLAKKHNAIVVSLFDVPNQYIFFKDKSSGAPKKEDAILAYTYSKVLEDPEKYKYMAGHLPMAKSIIKAMDALQKIATSTYGVEIDGFILSGASKRGWAAWLASLEDDRVSAIIPVVIDILNARENIRHICGIYKSGCPVALKDYNDLKIFESLDTQNGKYLMDIEDPFSYLDQSYDPKYKERLAIPKYIINASGDDFFAPDSSRFYFSKLPGQANYIRYIPNAAHYLLGKLGVALKTEPLIKQAIDDYLSIRFANHELPKLEWEFNDNSIKLTTSHIPKSIKLWRAHDDRPESRDFRCLHIEKSNYQKLSLSWLYAKKWVSSFFTDNLCDTPYYSEEIPYTCFSGQDCLIEVTLPEIKRGTQAAFLEAEYEISSNHDNKLTFITTTEINVVPAN